MAGFTSIAALTLSAGSAAAGFAQQAKQNNLKKEADAAAEKALEEAKQRLDVNYARQLQVPLESYRRAMRESIAKNKQLLEAAQEGDQRGVAASVGKIGAATTKELANVRDLMSKELYDRDLLIAEEDARIAGKLADIGLGEVEGAQIASANAERLAALAGQGALKGLVDTGLKAASLAPLYRKTTPDTPTTGASVKEIMDQEKEFMKYVPGTSAHQKANPSSYLEGVGNTIEVVESDLESADPPSNLENSLSSINESGILNQMSEEEALQYMILLQKYPNLGNASSLASVKTN